MWTVLLYFYCVFSLDVVDEDELLYGESSLPFTSVDETQEQKKTYDKSVEIFLV